MGAMNPKNPAVVHNLPISRCCVGLLRHSFGKPRVIVNFNAVPGAASETSICSHARHIARYTVYVTSHPLPLASLLYRKQQVVTLQASPRRTWCITTARSLSKSTRIAQVSTGPMGPQLQPPATRSRTPLLPGEPRLAYLAAASNLRPVTAAASFRRALSLVPFNPAFLLANRRFPLPRTSLQLWAR